MGVTEMLERQHREVLSLLDELDFTTDSIERTRLIALAALRLKVQAAQREDVFYPALPDTARQLVDDAMAAQRAIDLLLDEAVGTPSTANVKLLRSQVEQAFAGEERDLLPQAEGLDDDARGQLAARLERYARAVDEERAADL